MTTTRLTSWRPPRRRPPTRVRSGSSSAARATARRSPPTRCPACAARCVWTDETAQLGRLHNNANVVSLGARQYSIEDAVRFAEVFLSPTFSAGAAPRAAHRDADRLRALGSCCRGVRRWLIGPALAVLRRVRGRTGPLARCRSSAGARRRAVAGGRAGAIPCGSGRLSTRAAAWRITRSRSASARSWARRAGDVTRPHRAVDPDLGRAARRPGHPGRPCRDPRHAHGRSAGPAG